MPVLPVPERPPPGVAARRTVKRALLGFVVAILAVGLLSYACNRARVPRVLGAPPVAAGLTRSPTPGDDPLVRRLPPVGAVRAMPAGAVPVGPLSVRAVYGTGDARVVLVGGPRSVLTPQALVHALLPVTGTAPQGTTRQVDGGALGPLLCAPAPALGPAGASCVWADVDVVAATVSSGLGPDALGALTRRLRADAERPVRGTGRAPGPG